MRVKLGKIPSGDRETVDFARRLKQRAEAETIFGSAWLELVDRAAAIEALGFTASVIDRAMFEDGAVNTGTTATVSDDTIPQSSEGDKYMELAFTPKAPGNTLYVDVVIVLAHSTATPNLQAALYLDLNTGALAAIEQRQSAANTPSVIFLQHRIPAGTTKEITFKVHGGANAAGTTTFNGASGARLLGGVMASSIAITEIR